MTRRFALSTSVLLALSAAAGAQPPHRGRRGPPPAAIYRQGYSDGYAACSSGGTEAPAYGSRVYRNGYADGYRDCTLGPQGTLNSAGPPAAPSASQSTIDWSGWTVLGRNILEQPSEKLMIGGSAGRFSRIRIGGSRGAPFIQSIHVRLVNDQLRSFEVHRRLFPGDALDFDLGGYYAVSSITVTGRPEPEAGYQVAAR